MTQVWDESNRIVPVTVIEAGTNVVTQVRTPETDGYTAVQLGFGEIDAAKVTKPLAGHFEQGRRDAAPPPRRDPHRRRRRATRSARSSAPTLFAAGDVVDVTGTSKGKGFAGVMKRHGFHGVSASHGAHRNHRKPGSIGGCATPGRVFKGMRMAGRMGTEHGHHPEPHRPRGRRREGPHPGQGRRPRRPAARSSSPHRERREPERMARSTSTLDATGNKAGTLELPAEIFDVQVNIPLIHQVVVAQLAAARQGTHTHQDAAARSPAVAASRTARRAPVAPVRARSAHRSTPAVASSTARRRALRAAHARRR